MAATSTSFKIQYQGELRRLSPPPPASTADEDSWVSLEQRISQLTSLPVGSFAVKYTDEDGDLITLSTNGELADLISSSKSATSIRLQVFPKSPAPVTTAAAAAAAAAAATPESLSRTSTAEEQQENNKDEVDHNEDEDEDDDEDDDDATGTASSEEKGKEKIDETQQPESTAAQEERKGEEEEKPQDQQQQQQQQQQQDQQQQPSLKDVFEKAAQLGEKIQGIFEQHPEIGEEIESIRELFATVIVNQLKEQQRQQEELRQRHHDFLASKLRVFGFHPHPHPHCRPATTTSTSNQQQQQQQQEPPRAGCSRQQQGTGSYHCGPRRCSGQGAPAVHPFARVFEEKLSILENMGFVDRELNVFLLRKYQGSIEAIVQALSEEF